MVKLCSRDPISPPYLLHISPISRKVKLCSRDPAPPPLKYVQGGGGIFKDMAIHDLDMARSAPVFLFAGSGVSFF